MRRSISFLSAVCILSFCSSALAKTKHAPLPKQILRAKTAYIDNQSGLAYIGDRAYDEVSKWGRFKIVNSAKDADVVFLFTAAEYVSGYRTDADTTTRGTVDDSGNVQLNSDSTARTRAQTSGVTFLTVLDPKNGAALWSNRKTWGSGLVGLAFARSATRSLVKELRKRVDEQDADSKEGGEVDSAPGANAPEADAMVAERYLAMTPDGGVGLTRAIAWRMAKTYPQAWQKIGAELVNEKLKSSGIGADLQTLVGAVQEMRQAIQKNDSEAFGKAAGKLLGVPKAEEKPERLIVNDLLKRSKEQKSDSKELSELKPTLAANTPEGNATVAERFLARTPDGGVGLMRATARCMAETYPEAWSQISTDLVNSTLKEAAIGTDLQGLIGAVNEMRAAIRANDGDAFGRAARKLLGAPKTE
jgi:hypothetical protein